MNDSSSKERKQQAFIIQWKRWLPHSIICILIGVLFVWDRQLKKTDLQGYVLKDAQWTIGADDLPKAWTRLYTTEKWSTLLSEGENPLWAPLVEQRKRLGIRLSPNRWQTWFGSGATLSGVGEQWVLCTRPGVLARFLDLLNGGTQQFGIYHYRWNDGFLFISRSRQTLELLNDASSLWPIPNASSPYAITIQSQVPTPITTQINITDTWTISGQISNPATSTVSFAEIKPYSDIPVIRDYETPLSAENTFEGTLEIINPDEEEE